jgi:hypothetical protein
MLCEWHVSFLVYLGLLDTFYLQFYFPDGHPPSKELEAECLARMDQIYGTNPDGLPIAGMNLELVTC